MQKKVPWFRTISEGGVIVGSILLAFAIEASWGARQDRQQERSVLIALKAELGAAHEAFLDDSDTLRDQMEYIANVVTVLSQERATDLPTDSVKRLARGLTPASAVPL